ncbi:unnamed protein product, partial [Allacma fusca]
DPSCESIPPVSTQGDTRDGRSTGVHKDDSDLEVLGLFGVAKETTEMFSDPINQDLASKWNLFATCGISDSKKEELENLNHVPSNCNFIGAPKLNPELQAGINISEYVLTRDKQFVSWQTLIAGSLTQLGGAISAAMSLKKRKEISEIDLTGLMSQCGKASQMLLHLQHSISTTRRSLVAGNLKPEVKRVAEDTKLDSMLFGSDFQAKVKSQEEMSKVGKGFLQRKSIPQNKFSGRGSNFNKPTNKPSGSTYKKPLNYRSPLRSHQPRHRQSGRYY